MHSYQDALDYLYSFIDPTRKPAQTPAEAEVNLVRMRALLAALAHPQAKMQAVVVAGTKGKGSTCALIEAMARAAGLRTGLWTSPHLNSYRERIQIDRTLISQAELVNLVRRLRPTIDAFAQGEHGPPTTFDLGFALALTYFVEHGVQLAVLEIGLGGTYDAVNVITPLVSAISSISYDHLGILGRTLTEIAANKAGIMKPGVPAVTVPQAPEALAVVHETAFNVGAPLWIAEVDVIRSATTAEQTAYPVAPVPQQLRGTFQHQNARLAVAAALQLRVAGLPLTDAAIAAGLAGAHWPGRFELVPGTPAVLIDGAHNGDSAQRLVEAIQAELTYERLILVIGTSRDKDITAIATPLVPLADSVIVTQSNHQRAMDIDRIILAVTPLLRGVIQISPSVGAALRLAREHASPRDLIVVTGSLFLVGAARDVLGLAESD
jgi:dihydrofolate synthase / folylpolyglutamate synthase